MEQGEHGDQNGAGEDGGDPDPVDWERTLRSAEHRSAVIEALGEGVLVQDRDGAVIYANDRARDLLQAYLPEDGSDPVAGWTLVDEDGVELAIDELPGPRALAGGAPVDGAVLGLRSPDGEVQWLGVNSHPLTEDGDPVPYAVASSMRDVTGQRADLARSRFKGMLLNSVAQAVIAWDVDGTITFINTRAEELFGWPDSRALGRSISDIAPPDMDPTQMPSLVDAIGDQVPWEGEISVALRPGRPVPIWVSNSPVTEDGTVVGYVSVSADISERKAADALIVHRATHDALTDLPNRQALVELIDADRRAPHQLGMVGSIFLIDVGSLDVVNDAFGYPVGDEVITRCADMLAGEIHDGDVLARFSDQTFAVWCHHSADPAQAAVYGEQLRSAVAEPFPLRGVDVYRYVSAAVAVIVDDVTMPAELLRRADTALVRARREGTTRVYDSTMSHEMLRDVELEAFVDLVLGTGEVSLGYQPVQRLDDQCIVGAEALLRLTQDGLPLSAIDVIAAAERTGRIRVLGDLILRRACVDAATWSEVAPGRPIRVSVNLSALQLEDPELPARVEDALRSAGLDASRLCLEVTESALMKDPIRSAKVLADLKVLGVELSADDFGTGYSSLSYLKTFPLDELKIDQSFVSGIPANGEDVAITQAIIAMADALGLSIVAEGIETEVQLQELVDLGASYGQGYLWNPAVPPEAFASLLLAEAERQAAHPGGGVRVAGEGRYPSQAASSEERLDSVLNELVHEIRTPLGVVNGWANLLQEGDDEGLTATATAAVGRAVTRIDSVLASMIEVSSSGHAAVAADVAVLDAVEMVEQIVADLQPVVSNRLHLATIPTEPVPVSVDLLQMEQVVNNLISNAVRFSPPDSTIDVRVTATAAHVDVTVTDRGPGVEAKDLGLIFRKYGRVNAKSGGTGLGLYVARRIARTHGGDVRYRRPTPGPGAAFTLRIPRLTEVA